MFSKKLQIKIHDYYINYYKNDCSLKDFERRAKNRLNEEKDEERKLNKLEKIIGEDFNNKKHFIFGAGTGGLWIVLAKKYNSFVWWIEPNKEAFQILTKKFKETKIKTWDFKNEWWENLSFESNYFDICHCYTVLEHVSGIEVCIDEMIRIIKPWWKIYIHTPNYKFPYEWHYKIMFPTFLPKFLIKIYLLILWKSPRFLNTLNFVTEKSINKILVKKQNIIRYRIYKPKIIKNIIEKILFWLFFIYPHQEIIIMKKEAKFFN